MVKKHIPRFNKWMPLQERVKARVVRVVTPAMRVKASQENGKLGGRPLVYSPEDVADELTKWSKKETSINLTGFFAEVEYLPDYVYMLMKVNEKFKNAVTFAKMRISERRERLCNSDLLNYGSYNRYQSIYDPFLKSFEDDEKDADAKRRRGVAEAEQMNLVSLARMAGEGKISQKRKKS